MVSFEVVQVEDPPSDACWLIRDESSSTLLASGVGLEVMAPLPVWAPLRTSYRRARRCDLEQASASAG
jgi:hypothetical protein